MRSGETGQARVRDETQALGARLRAVAAEFERNGLAGGDDLAALQAVVANLDHLSGEDMARILALLQQASAAGDDRAAALPSLNAAYTGQRDLAAQMKGLLASFQKKPAAGESSAALARLAERQGSNLQAVIDLARWAQSHLPAETAGALPAALALQRGEQAALRDEARQAAARLEAAGQADLAGQLAALGPALDGAAADLGAGQLHRAAGQEKIARDGLRRLARALAAAGQPPADALRELVPELDRAVDQQRGLAVRAERQPDISDLDRWLAASLRDPKSEVSRMIEQRKPADRSPAALRTYIGVREIFAARSADLDAVAARQGELNARADLLGQDLQFLAADAAASVAAALARMLDARAGGEEHDGPGAARDAQAALASLEEARRQVRAQLAAENAAKTGAAGADRLRDAARGLAARQTAALPQSLAPSEAAARAETALQRETQALRDAAGAAKLPAAAQAFAQAAALMAQAAADLANPARAAAAPGAERAALDALQKAEALLAQEAVRAAATRKALRETQSLLTGMEKAIAGEEQVQAATAQAVIQAAAKNAPAAAPQELAVRQAALKDSAVQMARAMTTADTQPAAAAAASARDRMDEAQHALARANAAAALAPERAALASLYRAQESLRARAAALARELGQGRGKAQDAGPTGAEAVRTAQAQVQSAQRALGQEAPSAEKLQTAARDLDLAANQAGQAAAASEQGGAARAVLQQAQDALAKAAGSANAGNAAEAAAQAQTAGRALAQAQTAADQAQAGIARASDAGAGTAAGAGSGASDGRATRDVGALAQADVRAGAEAGKAKSGGQFTGLPPRERAVLQQSQGEKYPEEYAPLIEQYLRNLSEGDNAK